MPGEKAVWRENPGGSQKPWQEHLIASSACNESPMYVDLFRRGLRVLVMGNEDGFLGWFSRAKDARAPWEFHKISGPQGAGSQRYSHGLGAGDLDGDGRNEVLTTQGYYKAPQDLKDGLWTFHPVDLGPDCAQMLTLPGKNGVLTTSAHARGVWWHKDVLGGAPKKTVIDEELSVTHSAALVKIGGTWNLFTGKRKWAHPPGVDVGSDEPAWIVRYELEGERWHRYVVDQDSGVGTQFVVQDVDGDKKPDVVSANKNGVFFFRCK